MKTVLVTGGSSGIGAALARRAGKSDWNVIVGYGNGKERADQLVSEIRTNGGNASALPLALHDAAQMKDAVTKISTLVPRLDAVVLCASPAPVLQSFLKMTAANFNDQLHVNVVSNHALIVEIWKSFFQKQDGGHVVAVLSAAMESPPWKHMSAYVVAKAALQQLLESALAELGADGLRASAFFPDYTDTPMLQACHPLVIEAARASRPNGRFWDPDQVAQKIMSALENPPADARLRREWMKLT